MKKALSLILAFAMCFSLFACSSRSKKNEQDELVSILCDGTWVSYDHTFVLDNINREVFYTTLRFYDDGSCERTAEDYRDGKLTETSTFVEKWKIEDGRIAVFPGTVDSDSDIIYLEYTDGQLIGSAFYDDSFTYTHIPGNTESENATESITYSVGLEYVHNGDGTCTVVGMGTCRDDEIVIPSYFEGSKVTAIGDTAFAPWSITSIVIPDTVTHIGKRAFLTCDDLTNVEMGNGITSIGDAAFSDCTSLRAITIPEGVTTIGQGTFMNCTSLFSVTIPTSVTQISAVVFCECPNLYSINYKGTMAQWKSISFDSSWKFKSNISAVHCTDGDIRGIHV